MGDPMTDVRLDELVDTDPLQLRDAAIALLAERDAARAELERLRAEVDQGRVSIGRVRDELREALDQRNAAETARGALAAEVDRLVDTIARISLVRSWQDEDGRGFVYVVDLFAALTGKDPA